MSFLQPFSRISETIRREIEDAIGTLGILCRVFGRGKSHASVQKKISREPGKYQIGGRLIQDVLGLRVVIYFPEDLANVQALLQSKYCCDHMASTIDTPTKTTFSVSRHNLIFDVPDHLKADLTRASAGLPVDAKFEVQIRTILSEGWHEVEHDLRYKYPTHWEGEDELYRALNGVVATLETAEWSMRKIFDELAYKHYRKRNWSAMLHTLLRMRVDAVLLPELSALFDQDLVLAKDMFRINKQRIIMSLSKLEPRIPVNLDNIVYLWNYISVGNHLITEKTPGFLLESFERDIGKVEGDMGSQQ